MKIDNIKVYNFEGAIHGMRNPMNSWDKSDSKFGYLRYYMESFDFYSVKELWEKRTNTFDKKWLFDNGVINSKDAYYEYAYIGPNDMALMQKLILAGPEHSKFMRQIFISFDLTAPLYLWKEFDTYKIATTANSTSTMHKLSSTPITKDCFEIDDAVNIYDIDKDAEIDNDIFDPGNYSFSYAAGDEFINDIIDFLEALRQKYVETKDKRYWKELIRWLPESWLQTRTITMNYAVARNMYFQRKNHKLSEWHFVTDAISKLPYAKELILLEK